MSKYHFLIPRSEHYDRNQTGFYSTKNSSVLNLRIQESPHELEGIVRLNKENPDEYIFEGYNGQKWVQFNTQKGEKGDTGDAFSKLFKFENINNSSIKIEDEQIIDNNQGLIFKTLELNEENIQDNDNNNDNNQSKSPTQTIIKVRSLKSGTFELNNNYKNSINIKTKNNEIILNPNSQPFTWNFSNLNLDDLKTNLVDFQDINKKLKCYGRTSIWRVKKKCKNM